MINILSSVLSRLCSIRTSITWPICQITQLGVHLKSKSTQSKFICLREKLAKPTKWLLSPKSHLFLRLRQSALLALVQNLVTTHQTALFTFSSSTFGHQAMFRLESRGLISSNIGKKVVSLTLPHCLQFALFALSVNIEVVSSSARVESTTSQKTQYNPI